MDLSIFHFFQHTWLYISKRTYFLLPSTEMNYLKDFYFYIIFLSMSKLHDILYEVVVTPPVSNVISLHSWSQAQMKEEGYCR